MEAMRRGSVTDGAWRKIRFQGVIDQVARSLRSSKDSRDLFGPGLPVGSGFEGCK